MNRSGLKIVGLLLTLLVLGVSSLIRAEVTDSSQLDFERYDFGSAPLPIWSPLSPFETWAVSRFPAARNGDADALLALYLLASGEPVEMADYEHYLDEINAWMEDIPLSGDPQQQARDARRVFVGMHSHYFGTDLSSTDMPEKYHADQSQVLRVLETGEFNCISSSLLYIVAARKAGLQVDGVVLPSHAFVQLRVPGETLEVETTSFNGFGVVHDEAFYAKEASDWFVDRNLEPPSYADYQDREIVSPAELGLFNMINQHTAEDRMPYRARMRLAELRGHYLPHDKAAQKSRLAYYYQEFVYLREQRDYATARRMFDLLAPWLNALEYDGNDDLEFPVLLTAVQAQVAETLVRTDDADAGIALARHLLQTRDFPAVASSVESHLFSVISGYAVDRADAADYPGARLAFNALEFQCLQNRVCNSGLAQVYSAWALHYVEDRNWERSADIYREYLLLDDSSKLSEYFITNLERVYLNWAAREEWQGEWETAMGVLNQCTQMLSLAPGCEQALQELDEKVAAGYL